MASNKGTYLAISKNKQFFKFYAYYPPMIYWKHHDFACKTQILHKLKSIYAPQQQRKDYSVLVTCLSIFLDSETMKGMR